QTIDRVYLYDRPNQYDQITGGTLTFSDGSTVAVPSLANDGTATIVTFPARATTSLLLTVTSVSATTQNVGLAEIEAYNGDPNAPSGAGGAAPAGGTTPTAGTAAYDGPDVARNALASASTDSPGQEAIKAIDGQIDGWPTNGYAEWASNGQGVGAWLNLSWSTPQTIDRVYLYDRPNLYDQITGATLTFSDGSTVTVPALDNGGAATIVTFPARATTSLTLTVTGVSATTQNVGLAEIEAYDGDPGVTAGS
ncbi:MAG: hypothetical protein FWF16_06225, partial [Microbacteriaceae bacterium]|nr:hypothetical protein [Microbacteriaceae bacterium]